MSAVRAHEQRVRRLVLLGLIAMCVFSGCAQPVEDRDVSGVTEAEAMAKPLEEQYALAGERHRELQERFAELQREIYEGTWVEGGTSSEVAPGMGDMRSSPLRGRTRDNCYDFTARRRYETDEEIRPLVEGIGALWEAHGWEVSWGELPSGRTRVTARTEDGYWFEAIEDVESIRLIGSSPVYWGDQLALIVAVGDRRWAEDAAGAPWDTTDRDERGWAYRLPGVYRPFPAWDALEVGE